MKRPQLHASGFAALEALLVLVIIAILGGTGYYVYQANKKANDTYNSAATVASQKTTAVKPTEVTYKLPYENLAVKYSTKTWSAVQKRSSVDPECGHESSLQLQYAQNTDFQLGMSFGVCGKGGGICFYDGSPECLTQSTLVKPVVFSSAKTAYIVANRYSSDSGKTWNYELALTDDKTCKGLCFYTAQNVESKSSAASASFTDSTSSEHLTSLTDFMGRPEVKQAEKVFESAHY